MKIIIDRAQLHDAAQWVGRAVGKFVPVIAALKLEITDQGATVSAFDYDLSLSATVECEVGETGTVLLPQAFTAYLGSQRATTITVQTDGTRVLVEAGRSRSEFVTAGSIEDYPALPTVTGEPLGTMRSSVLEDAIAKLLPIVAKRNDVATPWRDALFITGSGPVVEIIGATKYRMGKIVHSADVNGLDIMVSANALANAAKGLRGDVDVHVQGGILALVAEGRTATVRLADKSNTPNLDRLFAQSPPDLITVDRDELLGAVRSVGMSSDQLQMTVGDGEMELTTYNPSKGDRLATITEVVSCESDGRGTVYAGFEMMTPCLRAMDDGPVEMNAHLNIAKPIHLKSGRAHFLFMSLRNPEDRR